MTNIHGYGTAIPGNRISLAEINRAWGRPGGRGERAIASVDEDVVTLCVKAARRALAHSEIEARDIGAIYACSVSMGYSEHTLAGSVALALGAEGALTLCDLGLSTRSVTAAIQCCVDAIRSGRIVYGLVVAGDILRARPGSECELTSGAGGATLVLGSPPGVAELAGIGSHTEGFIGRYRPEGGFPQMDDERFVFQQGFSVQTAQALRHLLGRTGLKAEGYARAVFGAPEPRWGARLAPKLGIAVERVFTLGGELGSAGCAMLLLDLIGALEQSQPNEKILALSWGPGGSDALALTVRERSLSQPTVAEQVANKELLTYPEYLRAIKLLGG
jgi:3-hydroxy-3-methylglutaryl CoA synthase